MTSYILRTAIALLVAPLAAAAADEAPFAAAAGLFQADQPGLGLEKAPGNNSLLYRATDDGYKFCHHPSAVVFGDELFVMWSNGRVGEDGPGQRILYSVSSDGRSWSKPMVLAEPPAGKVFVAAGFLLSDQKLVAFLTVTEGKNFDPSTALHACSSSDGRAWSQPRRITEGFYIQAPMRLPNGRLLLGGEQVGSGRENGRMRLLHSDQQDGLGGWQQAAIQLDDARVFGYTEPSPFLRQDGSIVMPLRNYSGKLFASISTDMGRAWTTPVQTNFPDSTSRFATGTLPDGTIYLINNPTKKWDRSILTIALSRDGVSFDNAMLVRDEPTSRRYAGRSKMNGWQYPNAVVWQDHLYIFYSINKEDVGVTRIALDDLQVTP